MAFLQTSDLCHRFSDGTQAISNVSLAFRKGEFTVIAGANGSGKTTLLRHLNGLLLPESGEVFVDGVPVRKNPRRARQIVGMVFQDADSQIVGDTVYDDVAFGPENLRLPRDQIDVRVRESLAHMNLSGFEDKRPHNLSGGEKRRLAIAGVLAMTPQVLLMDEPFSNLDYPGTCSVLAHILELHRAGHTIIVTTHDLEKVISIAQRLIVMQKGRVVEDGMPEDVVTRIERYGVRPPCSVRFGRGIQSWAN